MYSKLHTSPSSDNKLQPLRPFTILPSDAGQRARLQAEVFGPDYRLPTMSVDEYLEIERQRGNIITGGGYVFKMLLETQCDAETAYSDPLQKLLRHQKNNSQWMPKWMEQYKES